MNKVNIRSRFERDEEKVEYNHIKIETDFDNNVTKIYSDKLSFDTYIPTKVERYNSKNELELVMFYQNSKKYRMYTFNNSKIEKCFHFGRQNRIVKIDYCKDEKLYTRESYSKINSVLENRSFV